jgi:alpha-tubulin suppressor-like RCC1 family protein
MDVYDYQLFLSKDYNNQIYAIGTNESGQLGKGTADTYITDIPVPSTALNALLTKHSTGGSTNIHVRQVATLGYSGGYMLIENSITQDRVLYTWGHTLLGDGSGFQTVGIASPVQVRNIPTMKIIQVTTTRQNVFVLVETAQYQRRILGWGINAYGELGLGHQDPVYVPTVLPTIQGYILQISTGFYHVVALLDHIGTRTLYAWGANYRGQLGKGWWMNCNSPVIISLNATTIEMASCGPENTMVIVNRGGENNKLIYAWGANDEYQLGLDIELGTADINIPTPAYDFIGNILLVSPASTYTIALIREGMSNAVYYWGGNILGRLCLPAFSGDEYLYGNIVQIIASYNQVGYAIMGDGTTIYSWGFNDGSVEEGILNTVSYQATQRINGIIAIVNDNSTFPLSYVDKCGEIISYCKKMAMVHKVLPTGGNNPSITTKQKYSQAVRTFSRR